MSILTVSEQLTPASPSAGKMAVYCKVDGLFYTKNAAGVESLLNASALADKIDLTQKGAANGVATLDAASKIPAAQLPSVAITDTFPVASQAAQVALTAQVGDVAVRTDQNLSYILMTEPASVFANWLVLLSPTDSVTSVAGKVGVVTLVKGDVGLGNVDNTSDATKQAATNALLAGGTLPIAATTLSASGAATINIGSAGGNVLVLDKFTGANIDLRVNGVSRAAINAASDGMYLGGIAAYDAFKITNAATNQAILSSTGLAVTGAISSTFGYQLGNGYQINWGGAYGAGIPTIEASSAYGFKFYPTGSTSGVRAHLDAAGNLGLGVVPSAWGTYTAIQVKNAAFASYGTNYTMVGNNWANDKYIITDAASLYQQHLGIHYWYTAPSGTAGAAITFTQAMTLAANGALLNPAMYSVTTASASNAFIDTNGQIKRSTSTAALKTAVEDMDPALALRLVELFRAVWYRSLCPMDKAEWSWFGGIAEEVALIDPRFVHYGYLESDYEMITVDDGEIEEPVSDTVLVDKVEIELIAGVPTQVIKQVETGVPRVTLTQVVDLEGNPVIRTDITKDEEGNDVITQTPVTYPVPVTQLVARSHQEKKLKSTAVLVPIGLQYERFTVPLMLVAKMQEARIAALEAKP